MSPWQEGGHTQEIKHSRWETRSCLLHRDRPGGRQQEGRPKSQEDLVTSGRESLQGQGLRLGHFKGRKKSSGHSISSATIAFVFSLSKVLFETTHLCWQGNQIKGCLLKSSHINNKSWHLKLARFALYLIHLNSVYLTTAPLRQVPSLSSILQTRKLRLKEIK